MKIVNRIGSVFLVFCAMAIVLTIFKAYYSAGLDSRRIQNIHIMRLLATGVQMYQEQTGSFPNSFADVSGFTKNKQWFDDFRGAMDQAHSNIWRDVYIYQLSTNRFAITVTGYDCAPVGWFGKKRTIKHDFKSDDPFNELN